MEVLPTLVRHFGEPYADSSALPTYYVSKLTRQHVTVALTGDGGDESFAGYERYYANQIAERINAVGLGGAAFLLSRLLPDSADFRDSRRRVKRFLSVASRPPAERYARWMGFFSQEEKAQLYAAHVAQGGEQWLTNMLDELSGLGPVEAPMAADVLTYLPYDLLVKVDIASMVSALEARSPFLDHEVMEFAAQLPVGLKLRGSESKYLLKRAFADLLPHQVRNRGKLGFGVPVGTWFRGPLKSYLQDTLSSRIARERGLLNSAFIDRLIADHTSGRADHAYQLWSLLTLEIWFQEVAQQKPAAVHA